MSSHAKPQHLFATMLACVQAATTAVLGSGADVSRIVVEPPRDPTHGDMATNAAMVLAKDAGKKPRELAESIAAKLRSDGKVASADVAGPGFINLTLKANVVKAALIPQSHQVAMQILIVICVPGLRENNVPQGILRHAS